MDDLLARKALEKAYPEPQKKGTIFNWF